jgi:hypothetical protein
VSPSVVTRPGISRTADQSTRAAGPAPLPPWANGALGARGRLTLAGVASRDVQASHACLPSGRPLGVVTFLPPPSPRATSWRSRPACAPGPWLRAWSGASASTRSTLPPKSGLAPPPVGVSPRGGSGVHRTGRRAVNTQVTPLSSARNPDTDFRQVQIYHEASEGVMLRQRWAVHAARRLRSAADSSR